MFQKIKNQLEKIQNSSESVKRRWLVGATIISMIVIISLWLAYINNPSIQTNKEGKEEEQVGGFWQVFKTGAGVISGSIKNNADDLISKLKSDRTVNIDPAK